jgi:hypothetical protein
MLIQGMPQLDSGVVVLALALISFIAWLSRLESKSGSNADNIKRLERESELETAKVNARIIVQEEKLQQLDNRVMDKLSNIEKIVAKIEGTLSVSKQ